VHLLKVYSSKCLEGRFCELRPNGVLGNWASPSCHGVHTALEHIHSPRTGVCCLRYVVSRRRVKAQDGSLSSSQMKG